MIALYFRQFPNFVREKKALCEIFELENALQPSDAVAFCDLPLRNL